MPDTVVVNQFEIGNDAKGAARAAQWIHDRINGAGGITASTVLATATYDRETSARFLVIIMSSNVTVTSAPSATGPVVAVTAEIESAGAANLQTVMNAALAGSINLTKLVSFTVNRRESGSCFATAILSN